MCKNPVIDQKPVHSRCQCLMAGFCVKMVPCRSTDRHGTRRVGKAVRTAMRRIQLGGSGRTFAAIGLGCMGMSWGYDERGLDDNESIGVIRHAVGLGVDLIDTADQYGPFTNEELVGKALRGHRERVLLATKGGLVVDDPATYRSHRDGRPEHLRAAVDASLRRLAVDHERRGGRPGARGGSGGEPLKNGWRRGGDGSRTEGRAAAAGHAERAASPGRRPLLPGALRPGRPPGRPCPARGHLPPARAPARPRPAGTPR